MVLALVTFIYLFIYLFLTFQIHSLTLTNILNTASGSEDMSVHIFNVMNKDKPLINKLQGHSAPVIFLTFFFKIINK